MNRLTKHQIEKEFSALLAEGNARQWDMRNQIALELAPKIKKKVEKEERDDARYGSRARGKVQQTAGKPSSVHFYTVAGGDNGNGMEGNEPLWEAGHAMQSRDAKND